LLPINRKLDIGNRSVRMLFWTLFHLKLVETYTLAHGPNGDQYYEPFVRKSLGYKHD